MLQNNTTYDYEYDYNYTFLTNSENKVREGITYMYVVTYSVILSLGLLLHMFVICTIICKMKETAATIWFLGLSVTHLVTLLLLPLQIVSALDDFTWRFAGALCKICSYMAFINMHSTALMLAFISVIRCLSGPISRFFCRHGVSTGVVLLSWVAGGVLSTPSLLYRNSEDTSFGVLCRDTYRDTGNKEKAVVVNRFLFGWLCPLFVVFVTSCLMSMKRNRALIKTSKSYGIIRVMIIAYFLCWLPYHILMLFKLYAVEYRTVLLTVGIPIGTALSFLNSCLNPIIYIKMGSCKNMGWMQDAFSTASPGNNQATSEAMAEEDMSLQNAKSGEPEQDDP
ncbi:hypothetical protein SKAU_G00002030 [Synaphobranchus kaupii]|uniref:G-protein coupled receptors family 1 profile domain-containing protein n=1 Tax=Synaphobranchus kaupii TaxID=118154 RepID=A0A9Q1JC51_SYNKA|nr:hypothetical protein SKAU_G00002030 [Synaphobranchus kaupii]